MTHDSSKMPILCSRCTSFNLSADSFASRTTPVHDRSSTGCVPSHGHHPGGTDCNGQCDHSTQIELATIPFSDIQKERNCSLCRLVHSAVEAQYSKFSNSPGVQCLFRTKRHRFDANPNREKNYKVLQILIKDGKAKREASIPTVELLPVVSSIERFDGFFTGKKIKLDCIDPSEVKGWIDECCQSHAGPCRYMDETQFNQVRSFLRVIDVDNNCLVPLPEGSRYTALSYLWGQEKKPFKATKRNILTISKVGGLIPHLVKLPLVIRDAMVFTKSIAERYLWVDRLCIVQDEPAEIEKIIPKMNVVYENAFITYFSCGWGYESAGLTGVTVSTIPRAQIMADIAPNLTLLMPHNLEAMLSSPWAARGWT
jgi:Heterokaryon incompatibility protein (HET)